MVQFAHRRIPRLGLCRAQTRTLLLRFLLAVLADHGTPMFTAQRCPKQTNSSGDSVGFCFFGHLHTLRNEPSEPSLARAEPFGRKQLPSHSWLFGPNPRDGGPNPPGLDPPFGPFDLNELLILNHHLILNMHRSPTCSPLSSGAAPKPDPHKKKPVLQAA